jgi:hypothetical protein
MPHPAYRLRWSTLRHAHFGQKPDSSLNGRPTICRARRQRVALEGIWNGKFEEGEFDPGSHSVYTTCSRERGRTDVTQVIIQPGFCFDVDPIVWNDDEEALCVTEGMHGTRCGGLHHGFGLKEYAIEGFPRYKADVITPYKTTTTSGSSLGSNFTNV